MVRAAGIRVFRVDGTNTAPALGESARGVLDSEWRSPASWPSVSATNLPLFASGRASTVTGMMKNLQGTWNRPGPDSPHVRPPMIVGQGNQRPKLRKPARGEPSTGNLTTGDRQRRGQFINLASVARRERRERRSSSRAPCAAAGVERIIGRHVRPPASGRNCNTCSSATLSAIAHARLPLIGRDRAIS